jgi:hypothetical protein
MSDEYFDEFMAERKLRHDAEARIAQLGAALAKYIDQSTFGSPHGEAGLMGALAHHQMWAEYFTRILGSSVETKGDAT